MTKQYDPTIHHRRSIRLKGYDYSQPGAYFVTICASQRTATTTGVFGSIVNDTIQLNSLGQMIYTAWAGLPMHYAGFTLDIFVLMPDHLHGIIVIQHHEDVSAKHYLGLPDIVHRFKSLTTTRYRQGLADQCWPQLPNQLWQRNYYERIIRHDAEHNQIREYISENPAQLLQPPIHL